MDDVEFLIESLLSIARQHPVIITMHGSRCPTCYIENYDDRTGCATRRIATSSVARIRGNRLDPELNSIHEPTRRTYHSPYDPKESE